MNNKYWIAFSSVEKLDSEFIQKLYEYFGDIERAFNCSKKDLSEIEGLSIKKAEEFLNIRDKILQDIIYRSNSVVYSSQVKLIGEYQKCHALNVAILALNDDDRIQLANNYAKAEFPNIKRGISGIGDVFTLTDITVNELYRSGVDISHLVPASVIEAYKRK